MVCHNKCQIKQAALKTAKTALSQRDVYNNDTVCGDYLLRTTDCGENPV